MTGCRPRARQIRVGRSLRSPLPGSLAPPRAGAKRGRTVEPISSDAAETSVVRASVLSMNSKTTKVGSARCRMHPTT